MALFSDILLTVDYDRTLTAPDSSIPERNVEAIRYFIDNGGAFTVNTGRSLPMSRAFTDRVPVNAPLLLYNGAFAYDLATKETIFCHPIPLDPAETIRRLLEMYPDMTVEVQGVDYHYRFREEPFWDAFTASNRCPYATAAPEDDLGPFLKFVVFDRLRKPTVDDLFQSTPEDVARLDGVYRQIQECFGDVAQPVRSGPRLVDVQVKGVSKGRSARELQARLGRKVLVCVGDAENDLSMLHEADYAYTPSDGLLADRFETVCPCGEGSVADVIYKKIPEILEKNT